MRLNRISTNGISTNGSGRGTRSHTPHVRRIARALVRPLPLSSRGSREDSSALTAHMNSTFGTSHFSCDNVFSTTRLPFQNRMPLTVASLDSRRQVTIDAWIFGTNGNSSNHGAHSSPISVFHLIESRQRLLTHQGPLTRTTVINCVYKIRRHSLKIVTLKA